MSKRTTYLIFIAKFFFSISLIFWTIKITLTAGVGTDNDNSFLSTYRDISDNYNNIIENNNKFNEKYTTLIKINNEKINELSYSDIYLGQRSVKKRETNKNILTNGSNNIYIEIRDKNTNEIIKDINTSIVFTKPSTHKNDVKIAIKNSNENINFNLKGKSYWNIMGVINIDKNEGYFFIKTNSK
jgi:hypothetical protein